MTVAQIRNLVIQVAIVCAPGTDVLADSAADFIGSYPLWLNSPLKFQKDL